MKRTKLFVLILVLLAVVSSIYYLESRRADFSGSVDAEGIALNNPEKSGEYPEARDIQNSSFGFINTDPLTISELIGNNVVLVDFWTYSCINCQRTFPYLNAWWDKYEDDGLVILGVHTPEFEFEKDFENVQEATERFNIEYPVVLDNDYSTWRAYNNRYWPAKYLIGIDGYVIYNHFGEGNYEETERRIQEALRERAEKLGEEYTGGESLVQPVDVDDVDFSRIRTHEIYFGAWRNSLGNGSSRIRGEQNFEIPESISSNEPYLGGAWNIEEEYATNLESDARIVLEYTAKKVNLVAGSDVPKNVRVIHDGEIVSESRGSDVNEEGRATIQSEGLYNLINNSDYGTHRLEIIIEDPGLEVFTFTFG